MATSACHSKPPESPREGAEPEAAYDTTLPSREEFPELVLNLLTSPADAQRARSDVIRVVQYQLTRAADLYAKGQEEAAASATLGALLLLRDGDNQRVALRGHEATLLNAANGAARLGDSGQATALYRLALMHGSDATMSEPQEHLRAIADFDERRARSFPLSRAGEKARHELLAAVRDGSQDQYTRAETSLIAWIQMALEMNQEPPRNVDEHTQREHALEEYRALRSGGLAMLALAVRQGDPKRALDALDRNGLKRALPSQVRSDVLLAAAGESAGYVELYRLFDAARRAEVGEAGLPRPILDAAVFWSAVLAARNSDGDIDEVLPLAISLVEVGISEAAARLLSHISAKNLSTEGLSFCLTILGRGLFDHARAGMLEEAEQVYAEMKPLLLLARTPKFQGIEPSPSKITRVLAEAEVRAGRLKLALPLLLEIAAETPSPNVHLELAAIYRQAGQRDRALEAIDRAVQLAQAEGQLYTEAVAETERFEIEQEQGRLDEAAASLRRALERILTVRSLDLPVLSRAAIERQLARILEHYGDRDGVRRAYERALTESRGVSFELTATLTEMARASVTMADLELGRSALRSGVELGIESEGLLYLALWQLIVERTKSVPSNGLPVQVLEASGDLRGWLRGLRGWGLGRITGPELVRLADTKVEEVEGIFYTAILAPPEQRLPALQKVASSEAIGLVEVQIARALTEAKGVYQLPAEVKLP